MQALNSSWSSYICSLGRPCDEQDHNPPLGQMASLDRLVQQPASVRLSPASWMPERQKSQRWHERRMDPPAGRRHSIFCATKIQSKFKADTQVEWEGFCDLMGSLRLCQTKNIHTTHLPRTPSLLTRVSIPTI